MPSEELQMTTELLTLREVAERTGWDYERLRGWLKKTRLDEYVQARPLKGSKGLGYPPESLVIFGKLLEDAEAKKVVPTTLAGWLTELEVIGPSARSSVPAIGASDQYAVQVMAEAFGRLVRLADEVYTAQEAAAFLRCSVGTLRRRVPCSFRLGRSPRWYKSDLLRLG